MATNSKNPAFAGKPPVTEGYTIQKRSVKKPGNKAKAANRTFGNLDPKIETHVAKEFPRISEVNSKRKSRILG